MKRLRVRFAETADADFKDILLFLRRQNVSARIATGFVRSIRDRCRRIGDAPNGGRPRDDLRPGLRTVPFEGRTLIAYLVADDHVVITNVFYGGRDFEALMRD